MNRLTSMIAVVLVAASGTVQAYAVTYNVTTGLDSTFTRISSGGVSDAHWHVQQAQANGGGVASGQTVFPNSADRYAGWMANDPNSDWIARDASSAKNGSAPYLSLIGH